MAIAIAPFFVCRFSLQPSAFSLQPSAFSLQPSAFSLQPSALSRQLLAVSIVASSLSAEFAFLSPPLFGATTKKPNILGADLKPKK